MLIYYGTDTQIMNKVLINKVKKNAYLLWHGHTDNK